MQDEMKIFFNKIYKYEAINTSKVDEIVLIKMCFWNIYEWMPPAVCPADYQVLVWSSQVTDQPPTEILFPSFPLLFLILFPLQPPSSLLSSFPFSPFSQHHKSSELFPGFHSSLCCWLLWPLFSTHSWLFICLDTAEIIPLEDNAHFIYFFSRQDWMFLCHAKCSTGLKIWFLAHLSWHR